jgi:hypothetical protein
MTETRDPTLLRWILRTGAAVFGVSAMWLLLATDYFLELLGLQSSVELTWSMWMIALTLIALTGNMAVVSFTAPAHGVIASAMVMLVSAGALGFVTVLVPAPITWFGVLYALVGFGFAAAYLVGLTLWWRPAR